MKKFLESIVLDGTSLVSIEPTYPLDLSKNSTTVILKNETLDKVTGKFRGTYLGDIFRMLPHGIINKTETGIGATTLELYALRNSIIVEPLKVTASSKAKKHGAFYVGSATAFHKKEIKKDDIEAYLSDPLKSPKKFIVVADSLPRLIKVIGETVFLEYFILIDEVDSFQKDSTYRSSMEICIDYYKSFPKEKRAFTTATMMSFSDPDIISEPETIIKYKETTEKPLILLPTQDLEGQCFDIISNILSSTEDKILIAHNNVSGCYNIAENLLKEFSYLHDDIAILCGNTKENKTKVKRFFNELSSEILPKRVNFITSAYFSGFDLKERYHLIMLTSDQAEYSRLSVKNVIQISGRCRDKEGLLSNMLICKIADKPKVTIGFTVNQLLEGAEGELASIKCIESNFEMFPALKSSVVLMKMKLSKNDGIQLFKFVRSDVSGKYVKSFFNIDATIESYNTQKIHENIDALVIELESSGFEVSCIGSHTATKLKDFKEFPNNKEIADLAIATIEKYSFLIYAIVKGNMSSSLDLSIYRLYESYKLVITKESLLNALKACFSTLKTKSSTYLHVKSPNLSRFNRLTDAIWFFCLDENDTFKRNIILHFPIGALLTKEDKHAKFNRVCAESLLGSLPMTSKKIEMLKAYISLKPTKTKDLEGNLINVEKIVDYNPMKLAFNKSYPVI